MKKNIIFSFVCLLLLTIIIIIIIIKRRRKDENFTETDLTNCQKSLTFIRRQNQNLKKKIDDENLAICDQQVKEEFLKYTEMIKERFPTITEDQFHVLYLDLMNKQSFNDITSEKSDDV